MEILSSCRLAEKIREVCQTPGPRKCAVAFWGHPVGTSLFGDDTEGVEVILDISMGGTTKNALISLRDQLPGRVSVLDGLHAKIYVSKSGAVIGSANASRNALGSWPEDTPRLEEVGVWIDACEDRQAYADAVSEFDRLKHSGGTKVLSDSDLERAPVLSRATSNIVTTADDISFLSLVRSKPSCFRDVLFALGGDDYSGKEEEREVNNRFRKTIPEGVGKTVICEVDASYSTKSKRSAFTRRFSAIVLLWWFKEPGIFTYTNLEIIKMPSDDESSSNYALVGEESWLQFKTFLSKGQAAHLTYTELPADKEDVYAVDLPFAKQLVDGILPRESANSCWLLADEICRLADGQKLNVSELELREI